MTALLGELVGPAGRVVAFEALPNNAALLRDRLAASRFKDRVTIENLAVSDHSGEVELFSGRGRSSAEWNIVGRDVEGKSSRASMKIQAVALDDFFSEEERLDFVKIDVEGAEGLALRGMQRLLHSKRPILAIEFHSPTGWASRQFLYRASYELRTLKGRILAATSDEERVYQCLAFPAERLLAQTHRR